MCKDRPFSREEFRRRQPATVAGIEVHLVTIEDSILSKLEWALATGSDRQRRDIAGMLHAGAYAALVDRAKETGEVPSTVSTDVAAALIDFQLTNVLVQVALGEDPEMLRAQATLSFAGLTS